MRNKLVFLVVFLSLVLVINLVSAQDYASGEIIVGFNDGIGEEEAKSLIESYGLECSFQGNYHGWLLVKVLDGEEQKWIEVFENEGIVKYAELNWVVTIPEDFWEGNSAQEKNYNFFFIIGGIILVAIALFFILRKRK